VYEYIITFCVRDESVTFLVIKPFNCTVHYSTSTKII
jgi:hypothetical protein